jgi:hypothetical protein
MAPVGGQVVASGVVAALALCRWIVVRPRCLRACRRVDEDYDPVTDGLRVDEPQPLLVGRFAEDAPSGPQDDRVDHQPQLVDGVVLNQGLNGQRAAVDHDLGIQLLARLGDSSTTSRYHR